MYIYYYITFFRKINCYGNKFCGGNYFVCIVGLSLNFGDFFRNLFVVHRGARETTKEGRGSAHGIRWTRAASPSPLRFSLSRSHFPYSLPPPATLLQR